MSQPTPLTLISKGISLESFAQQIAEWFQTQRLASDGHLVWQVAEQPNTPLLLSNSNFSDIDKLLETRVYQFFHNNCIDPVFQLETNFYPTMNDLPQQLDAKHRLVQRHSSIIFKFKQQFVSLNPKRHNFRTLQVGSRLWTRICSAPFFIRELDIAWTDVELSSSNALKMIWDCPLTDYLLGSKNMPHSIVLFYAMLGRLLHQPRHYEQWKETVGIMCSQGESVLVWLIKLLFNPFDIRMITPFGAATIDDRPAQLTLCYVEPQGGKKRTIIPPEIPKKSHYLLYGDLRHIKLYEGALLIYDDFSTQNTSRFLTLRSHLPETIQVMQHVYQLTVNTLGSNANALSPKTNMANLAKWISLWQIPCPICKSQSMCSHIFDTHAKEAGSET